MTKLWFNDDDTNVYCLGNGNSGSFDCLINYDTTIKNDIFTPIRQHILEYLLIQNYTLFLKNNEYWPQSTVKGKEQGGQGGAMWNLGADITARERDTATCDTNPENERKV